MAILSRNQRIFARELVRQTGLDPSLVGAWIISEQPAGAAHPVGHQDQNWLNIGLTDSRWYGGASAWQDPAQAGQRSAAWLQGKQAVPGFGKAAPGIVNFSRTAGQSLQQQIAALQRSGWASSGYPNLPSVVQQNAGKYGINLHGGAPAGGAAPQFQQVTRNAFDQQGFDDARRQFTLGQVLQRVASPFKPERRSSLLSFLPQQAPAREDYASAVTSLRRMAGGLKVAEPRGVGAGVGTGKRSGEVIVASGADRAGTGTQPVVKNFLGMVAGSVGAPITITTGTNHSQMTTSGNVSDHWDGHAADIGVPDDSRQGDMIAGRALLLLGVPRAQARKMAQQGGLYTITPTRGPMKGRRVQVIWKTNEGGNHHNHVHIGIR